MPGSFIFVATRSPSDGMISSMAPLARLDEVVAVVLEIDDEVEVVHVPLGQAGVRRGDRGVFQSLKEHT